MRMWGVNPSLMCDRHLLGEHVEMHMLVGCIKKSMSLDGYMKNKLVRVDKILERHDDLVKEFERRNFSHKSPISAFDCSYLPGLGNIDIGENLKELKRRCPNCKKKIMAGAP
jgi:hypothetical protein